MLHLPYIYEHDGRNERAWDIYSRLLKDRIIFIGTAIDDNVANAVIAQLLFLSMEGPGKPIKIYINSPGGSVSAGMAMHDTMKLIGCPIETYCIGMAASMGAVLLACGGTKGHRFSLPNSQIMIHQPLGGAQGQASDISIAAENIIKWRLKLNTLLANASGRTLEEMEKATDRDNFMSPEEAKAFGLIDEVITLTN